jgi:hypothetical protein
MLNLAKNLPMKAKGIQEREFLFSSLETMVTKIKDSKEQNIVKIEEREFHLKASPSKCSTARRALKSHPVNNFEQKWYLNLASTMVSCKK